jgi:hypothetical protein
MLKSTKLPAAIETLPLALQEAPEFAEQLRAVSARLPRVPARKVTEMVLNCIEYTFIAVAVHATGTHVRADMGACSVVLAFWLFTE